MYLSKRQALFLIKRLGFIRRPLKMLYLYIQEVLVSYINIPDFGCHLSISYTERQVQCTLCSLQSINNNRKIKY